MAVVYAENIGQAEASSPRAYDVYVAPVVEAVRNAYHLVTTGEPTEARVLREQAEKEELSKVRAEVAQLHIENLRSGDSELGSDYLEPITVPPLLLKQALLGRALASR